MIAEAIIRAALGARTVREAEAVDTLVAEAIGARTYRPVGDKVNNFGLMTTSGSYDFKLIENLTNMQDALLERAAGERFGAALDGVPYMTPHEAAGALLRARGDADLANAASVEFYPADASPRTSKRITPVFRDRGCGIEPRAVANTIFALGSAHKSKAVWQQGAFGIGGATTFRNADAVILVTRRAPEMAPTEDRIVVAVCLWQHSVKGKGLFYLVTSDWSDGQNPNAVPWSAPAAAFPEFEPGTHLALINYGTERLHAIRHSDNPNSFDRIVDTRLFRPVTPIRFKNHLIKGDHARVRRGLGRRFEDNPRADRIERTAAVPFRVGNQTYNLPITFYFFDSASRNEDHGTVGDKKNFVAHGHSLVFTSNGQVHHHWTPLDFRDRTKLNKVADHALVVVETDPLPIAVRTDFFTADRAGVRASEETLRLESTVANFLHGWDELRDINNRLILESIRASRNERPTLEISRQISRAYAARANGFALHGGGRNGTNGHVVKDKEPKPPTVLNSDPTMLRGPERVRVLAGTSKTVRYSVDARNEFFSSGRGQLIVECTHPDVTRDDIAVGPAHNGQIRVIVTVPTEAQLGDFALVATIKGWEKASGGLGDDLRWATRFSVVASLETAPPRRKRGRSKSKSTEGPQVALLWRAGAEIDLTPIMPGKVEEVAARLIAAEPEYAELAKLNDTPVLTIYLNEDYAPLKRYVGVRQRDLARAASSPAYERYAVDVGVAMLVLHHAREARIKRGEVVDETLLETARQAAAQGAVSILPQFDELAKQAGLEV
ncbi:MAG TPA: hypothetical protein VFJ77_03870 [Gaiellaceae bacterium]|nr:hypothetical protein [Gaiellaceae bacterium]